MTGEIDFTDCKQIPGRAYNGANGKKIAVEYLGKQYMLKFPPSGAKKMTELSYTNSCISEHIASSIFNILGVMAHDTMLGTFNIGNDMKIVCACLDFTADGKTLYDFCSIKNTVLDSESGGTGTELYDILDTIEKQKFVAPDILSEHFWGMFVIDALLGNSDRHFDNWGLLEKDEQIMFAPIYDCGSSLGALNDDSKMSALLAEANLTEFKNEEYNVTSCYSMNGKRIFYHEIFKNPPDDLIEAIKRTVPVINMEKLYTIIDSVKPMSEIRKEYLKKAITIRYEQILLPALTKFSRTT